MRLRAGRFIDDQEAAYLALLINDGDSENRKIGLERICLLYRRRFRFKQPAHVVVHIVGLLHDEAARVRRWALNALALIGTKVQVASIVEAIQRNRNDPDILAAGISALCSLLDNEEARKILASADLPLEGPILLAATQHSDNFEEELRATRINIEKASVSELRLAGILLGLNRAPENLFHPRFDNNQIIGELNRHEDRIVAQYSVWATHENPKLGLRDLRLDLRDIESCPPNVRKYIYRLISFDAETAKNHYDYLVVGSEDDAVEARAGLALGLRDVYFDSLEKLIFDWYADEDSEDVKHRLLEHMAANADKCPGYEAPVLAIYRGANQNSLTRSRLESAARKTDFYLTLKRIAHDAEGHDLFGGEVRAPRSLSRIEAIDEGANASILIVAALPKEVAAVKATFDARRTLDGIDGDKNIYEVGTYVIGNEKRNVILASSGMGKLNASTVASNALRSFPKIKHVIMVGIAGGCPNVANVDEHVRLGDVVFSAHQGIVEYDNVKETPAGRHIRGTPQRPSEALLAAASHLQSEELLGNRPWEAFSSRALERLGADYDRPSDDADILHAGDSPVPHPNDPSRRKGHPKVHAGGIAAADTLLKNAETRDQLRDKFGVKAVEMEGSGLQTAARAQGKDVFIVRGICDYCDTHKNDIWQKYAALTAATFARALIEVLPKSSL